MVRVPGSNPGETILFLILLLPLQYIPIPILYHNIYTILTTTTINIYPYTHTIYTIYTHTYTYTDRLTDYLRQDIDYDKRDTRHKTQDTYTAIIFYYPHLTFYLFFLFLVMVCISSCSSAGSSVRLKI